VLLEAPAGYAKTTTLKLWDRADPRPFAWVSCRPRHSDPAVFAEAVVAAVEGIAAIDPSVLMALAAPSPDLSVVAGRLGAEIARIEPFVLVLDDTHLVCSDDSWFVILSLLDALPPGSQVAIATRRRPDLPLGSLRAHGELVELGMTELALTRAEAREVLSGFDFAPVDRSDEIHAKAEGWPAALYLAGLLLSRSRDEELPGFDFKGSDRMVVEYLRDEFLDGMDEDRARFLRQTSVLDELTGPVCDAVTGRNDSALLLERLSRDNALVVPLDRENNRFRYHHLLGEMLRSELQRREPEALSAIHRRAAIWLSANGDIPAATDHAIAAGEYELAGAMIWLDFPDITGRGRIATLDRWLAEIGDHVIARVPALLLARVHRELAMARGEESLAWMAVAVREIGQDSPFFGDLMLLRATFGEGGPRAMIEDASTASGLLDPTNPWQVPCRLYQGIGHLLAGESDAAGGLLRETARDAARISPLIQVLALAQLTLIELGQGRADEAHRRISQASEQVERCGLGSLGIMALVHAVEARVFVVRGQSDRALASLQKARRTSHGIASFVGWFEAELVLVTCQTLIGLGRRREAAEILPRAADLVSRVPGGVFLEDWLAGLAVGPGGQPGQVGDLTPAELRLLRFLPTHHSFREISEQLLLSPNTVKTEARFLYRKLGVGSRTDAVLEARRLGLVA